MKKLFEITPENIVESHLSWADFNSAEKFLQFFHNWTFTMRARQLRHTPIDEATVQNILADFDRIIHGHEKEISEAILPNYINYFSPLVLSWALEKIPKRELHQEKYTDMLAKAIDCDDKIFVDEMLNLGVDVNALSFHSSGWKYPLMTRSNSCAMTELFLAYGADVYKKGDDGQSVFEILIRKNSKLKKEKTDSLKLICKSLKSIDDEHALSLITQSTCITDFKWRLVAVKNLGGDMVNYRMKSGGNLWHLMAYHNPTLFCDLMRERTLDKGFLANKLLPDNHGLTPVDYIAFNATDFSISPDIAMTSQKHYSFFNDILSRKFQIKAIDPNNYVKYFSDCVKVGNDGLSTFKATNLLFHNNWVAGIQLAKFIIPQFNMEETKFWLSSSHSTRSPMLIAAVDSLSEGEYSPAITLMAAAGALKVADIVDVPKNVLMSHLSAALKNNPSVLPEVMSMINEMPKQDNHPCLEMLKALCEREKLNGITKIESKKSNRIL